MSTPTNADRLVNAPDTPVGEPKSDRVPLEGQTVEPSQQRIVPRNLEGKEPDAIVDDYSKLQAAYGRQSNEIGELRRQIAELSAAQQQEDTSLDWDDDTAKAVDSKVRPIQQKIAQLEADRARAELRSTHPGFEETFQDPGFREWLHERRSRTLLAMSADAGDIDAARELLDTYGAAMASGDATPQEAVRRDRVSRASATERGTGRRPSGQVWSRLELQNMRAFSPTRYQELLPEIKRAYREGRVKD